MRFHYPRSYIERIYSAMQNRGGDPHAPTLATYCTLVEASQKRWNAAFRPWKRPLPARVLISLIQNRSGRA